MDFSQTSEEQLYLGVAVGLVVVGVAAHFLLSSKKPEGSRHTLPLTTVYRDLQPINASPYTFLQVLFGLEYHVGLLYEEKMLHLGKNITDVGICNLKNGIPEIKSCKDLPYFLSDLNKDQIVAVLSFKSNVLIWRGLLFGSVAIGILGYSISSSTALVYF